MACGRRISLDPMVAQMVGHRLDHLQQQFAAQVVHLPQFAHLGELAHDYAERIALDVGHVHFVGRFEQLQHILHVNVVLEIVFAVGLQAVI